MQTNTEENKTVCLPLKKGKLHTEMCASFSVIMHLSETENNFHPLSIFPLGNCSNFLPCRIKD